MLFVPLSAASLASFAHPIVESSWQLWPMSSVVTATLLRATVKTKARQREREAIFKASLPVVGQIPICFCGDVKQVIQEDRSKAVTEFS